MHTAAKAVHAWPKRPFSDELVDTVRLSLVSGVGPLLRKALLERFGTAAAVLAASKDELQACRWHRAEDCRADCGGEG